MSLKSKLKIDFHIPTKDEVWESYLKSDNDPNQFHNWFSKINNEAICKHFPIPHSHSVFLEKHELFNLIEEKGINTDEIQAFNERMEQERLKGGLHYPIFVKNGLFSGKFDFDNCLILNKDEFYNKLRNTLYTAMCLGVSYSREVVMREFIDLPVEMKIYNNMPLHQELRAFVDFDTKQPTLVKIIDYWHPTIVEHLPQEQQLYFTKHKTEHLEQFKQRKSELEVKINQVLAKQGFNGFSGQWSMDFMYHPEKDNFVLIDMALAQQSWGFHYVE